MTEKDLCRRATAVKTADAINSMGGVPVSEYATELSLRWACGEITGEQMKKQLLSYHRALATKDDSEQL